ncbi:TIGR02302 family protein [Fodinicurvata fenggangensis]|uniref:TIGR02302 family protein n=1 Tax=Fodinicurvata fenggangensis TaxID=1121830 RepID=UPI00068A1779|nr:TIGR02302 family protein [Fodinicurvata fenggangensis]
MRFRWLQWLSSAALVWETLWPRLWPLGGLCGLFLLVALSGLLPLLPGWLHGLVLAGFGLAGLLLVYRALHDLRWPSRNAAQRRLERDSTLAHRPISSLEDKPAGEANGLSAGLWHLHQQRLQTQSGPLKLAAPRAGWSRVDPFGLRAALCLLLLIAFIGVGANWQERLEAAVNPAAVPSGSLPTAELEAWISPPNYVDRAPIYLSEDKKELAIPEGSRLTARVNGGTSAPSLQLAGSESAFDAAGNRFFEIESPLRHQGELAILQDGQVLGRWTVEISADEPPKVRFEETPSETQRKSLQFAYKAEDDHGLAQLRLVIRPISSSIEGKQLELPLSLPQGTPLEAEGRGIENLTAHPWAGLKAQVWLEVEDARNQSGKSEEVRVTLPEREFSHPVARTLIKQRKRLILKPGLHFWVARQLAEVGAQTQAYDNDILVALAIRSAEQRLLRDRSRKAMEEVQRLLWDTALHLEEGESALAEQDLRDLQEQLQEAFESGASSEELSGLMEELESAMQRYLRALMEEALRAAENGDLQPEQQLQSNQQAVSAGQLQEMLDQVRELMQSGNEEAAREMLAELQSILENLEMRAGPTSEMQQQMQQSREMMNRLQDIMQGQSDLLDESFRQSREANPAAPSREGRTNGEEAGPRQGRGPDSAQGENTLSQAAGEQESLRRELGELMREYGNMTGQLPQPLGQAETSMRSARDSLQDGQPGQAGDAQARALDQLQQGMDSLLENFAQQMGQGAPQGATGPPGQDGGQGRDPLGRRYGGDGRSQGDAVQLPEAGDLQRAREILDELRQRSGQRDRPEMEREYLDRLLEQF